ncbi:DUF4339 domain-containing protein [Pedosphaera parvula]|uniref:RDD domain containing protein n=1 Tax=Pedosphaera parvula (strain Ellin514) TaxID=320771 RepID=B9XJK5_PEDPL|nr:DUF4339 domain-containing protein [Pedosphaera parvula]EEF59881.1 RDD domain containing protein [Pedosphaera parvula Ellin514]
MYRIIGANHVEYGPLTAEQLRQYILEGRADANTQAKFEGTENWKPLGTFPEFAAALNPAPAGYASSPPPAPGSLPAKTNGMAITSLIFGILSLLIGWACCGPLLSLLGIIFGIIGISQTNKSSGTQTGKGMAITGIVLSILGLIISVIIIVIFGLVGALRDSMH